MRLKTSLVGGLDYVCKTTYHTIGYRTRVRTRRTLRVNSTKHERQYKVCPYSTYFVPTLEITAHQPELEASLAFERESIKERASKGTRTNVGTQGR